METVTSKTIREHGGGCPRILTIGVREHELECARRVMRSFSIAGSSGSSALRNAITRPIAGQSLRVPIAGEPSNPSTQRNTAATLAPLPPAIHVPLKPPPSQTTRESWSTAIARTTRKMQMVSGGILLGASAFEHAPASRSASDVGANSYRAFTTGQSIARARVAFVRPTKLTRTGLRDSGAAVGRVVGGNFQTAMSRCTTPKPQSVHAPEPRSHTSLNTGSSWKKSWGARFSPVRTSTTSTASETTTALRTSNSGSRLSLQGSGPMSRNTALLAPARSGIFTLA